MSYFDLFLSALAFFLAVDAFETRSELRRARALIDQMGRIPTVQTVTDDWYYGPVTLTATALLYDQDQEQR